MDNIYNLTERELEVLSLIVKGKTNTEIAKTLLITTHTTKAHVISILRKTGVKNRVKAAMLAFKKNLA